MKLRILLTFFIGCFSLLSYAATDPLKMLQDTSEQVIAALQKNKTSLKNNPQIIYDIVDKTVVPHVDLEGMARTVIGKIAWQQATPQQQQQFIQEFKTLLIRTYASAFASYDDEVVQFQPIRGGVNGNYVQVNSLIVPTNGPSIPVNYRLVLKGQEWKVYDFSVEGISMLESFRSQFSNDLVQQGLAGLIKKLAQYNAQPQSLSNH